MKRYRFLLLILAALVGVSIKGLAQDEYDGDTLAVSYKAAAQAAKERHWDELVLWTASYRRNWKGGTLAHTKGQFAQILEWERQALLQQRKNKEAAALLPEIVELQRADETVPRSQLAVSLANLASIRSAAGNYTEAVPLQEEAVRLLDITNGPKHKVSAAARVTLAAYLFGLEPDSHLQRCSQLVEQALPYIKGEPQRHADAMNALVLYYSRMGEDIKANELAKKALKAGRKAYGEKSIKWAGILTNHSVRFARSGNYTRAVEYADEAYTIYRDIDAAAALTRNDSLPYAKCLSNLASYLVRTEQLDRAIETYNNAIALYKNLQGPNGADCVRCTSELAAIYTRKGDLEKGEEMERTAMAMLSGNENSDASDRARIIFNQAETAALSGNYDRAIKLMTESVNLYVKSKDNNMAASARNVLSGYYYRASRYAEARQWGSEALAAYEAMGKETQGYALALNNVSMYHYADRDYTAALSYARRAADMFDALGLQTNSHYAKVLNNVSMYYFALDSVDQAINTLQKACKVQEAALGTAHPDNVLFYFNMANYYYRMQRPDETCDYYSRALNMQMDFVRSNFAYLTSAEREMYWNKKNYVLRLAPALAYMSGDNDALASNAYNALLFTKGLLLNSEIDFKNLLFKSGDKALLDKYKQLETMNKQIYDFLKMPDAESKRRVQELRTQAAALEKDLVRGCKEFGSFTQNLSIKAVDVAKALGDDDVAVEFVGVRMVDGDYGYAALVLRHGWKAPKLVKCFTMSTLNQRFYVDGTSTIQKALQRSRGVNEVFADSIVGQMVWDNLIAAWGNGVKNVYFSPAGMFYQMGIEYLPYRETSRMCDDYNMYRVSSTKSVCLPQGKADMRSAAVFGGLHYDLDISEMQDDHRKLDTGELTTFYAMNDVDGLRAMELGEEMALDSLLTRGISATYLPGTHDEAVAIHGMLLQNDVIADLYPSSVSGNGTEEAFKRLSGERRSIIHIATHGFYFTEQDIERASLGFMKMDEDAGTDNSMNYSGLLMAGANNALSGMKMPAGLENGILTAKEISLLDFRDLDLVVLSACNTGRGEVKDDGVFGLQRGFKKAGAGTLLMSLWSVSDAATKVMMTSFYDNLLKGIDKHEAFTMAQQSVRDAGFTDPYYWASFIMLDAK